MSGKEFNDPLIGAALLRRRIHMHLEAAVGLHLHLFVPGVWFDVEGQFHF